MITIWRHRPDPTVILDEKNPRASRIVFNDTKVKISTPGVAIIGDTGKGQSPASEYPDICDHTRHSRGYLPLSPLGEDIGDTGEEEGEPGVTPMGTHQRPCVVRFPLTSGSFSSGESLGEHSARGCHRSH